MTAALDLVVTETEAAKLLRVSSRTLQRLRLDGGGPTFVRLTEHRIGYRPGDLARWIESRIATSTSAATTDRGSAA